MFTFNTSDVKDFVREAEQQHQPSQVLQHGGMFRPA
jgi:hypothetical protein